MPPKKESISAALALETSPIPALRKLTVQESPNAVVIAGRLPSYYLKQLAQEAVKPVLAGRRLLNNIQVVRELLPAPV